MTTAHSVCIVEDAADYCSLLKHLFNRYYPAYGVSFFANGQHFLDELSGLTPSPSLILLDQHMPTLDGYQTLLRLKQHPLYKLIPVVMMSTDASVEEIDNGYEAGVSSFLGKQMDLNRLREQFDTVCQYWLEMNQKPVATA